MPVTARRRRAPFAPVPLVVLVLVVAMVAFSGNSPNAAVSHAGDTNGVTATTIRVGALASLSGFASSSFAPVVAGAAAYFDSVNASGGVDGRRIIYGPRLDDGTSPNGDLSAAQQLVQDKVFAVVGVGTPFFTGSSVLQAHAVPTFGLQENTNAQWAGPTMFGEGGSYNDFTSPMPQVVYVARHNGVRRAAVLAYNVAQSSEGCISITAAFARWHIPTPVIDTSIPYGTASLDADVTRMQRDGVNFVATCMDSTGNIKLAQTLQQHGMSNVTQFWLDGYDKQILRSHQAAMDGAYFLLQQTPFEVTSLDPGRYPGIDHFNQAMARYEPGTLASVPALAGWVSADLFVTGLRLIGRDVSRSALVTAINALTEYNADGAIPPVNWTVSHTSVTSLDCSSFVQARHGRFVPVYGTGRSTYVCFTRQIGPHDSVVTVPLPPGVPGR